MMFLNEVTVRIKKDKKFPDLVRIIKKYDNSLSLAHIKKAMENNDIVFSFDPKNNPIIENGKDNSTCFLEEYFIKTLRLLKKAGANMLVKEGTTELLEYSKVTTSKADVAKHLNDLDAAKDGVTASEIINKLVKIAKKNDTKRIQIAEALMKYSIETSLPQMKYLVISDINEIVKVGEKEYADYYKTKIKSGDNYAAYFAIIGLAKIMQKEAYEFLVETLLSNKLEMECKALIVCELSRLSNNPFDQGSPYEKREWKNSDLKLEEISKWKADGYPDGNGYKDPEVHHCLVMPQTSCEKIYASLDKKLAKKREKNNDKAHPTCWLIKPTEEDLSHVKNELDIPDNYLDFLIKASPLNVEINLKGYGPVAIFGVNELIDAQEGYSFDPIKKEKIEDWPMKYIVIATCFANPFVLIVNKLILLFITR